MAKPTVHRSTFHLPITTEEHLRDLLFEAFNVSFPDTQVCPNHSTPWRAFCDAFFARSPIVLAVASRGFGGKSMLASYLGLAQAIALKADVTILGGSGEQSRRVHEHMNRAWQAEAAPRYLLSGEPEVRKTVLKNGATIHALLASQSSVRGPHPSRLLCDEAEDIPIELLDAALGQPMTKNGVTAGVFIDGTYHIPNGTMATLIERAKTRGYICHQWCFKESMAGPHAWLSEQEVERKRATVTSQMWRIEYEVQQPNATDRALLPDQVEQMFEGEEIEDTPGEPMIFEPRDPQGVYVTGADWARQIDHSVIPTLRADVLPLRLVAYERSQRLPWPVMIGGLDARLNAYPGECLHDVTGIGDVIAGYLTQPAEGIILAGRTRSDILTAYLAAIERGEIRSPRIKSMYREHLYATTQEIYGPKHLPDSVCAMALAAKLALGSAAAAGASIAPTAYQTAQPTIYSKDGSVVTPQQANMDTTAPMVWRRDYQPSAYHASRRSLVWR